MLAYSTRSQTGATVNEFARDVEVTGVSRGLLDHVQHDGAHVTGQVCQVGGCRTTWR